MDGRFPCVEPRLRTGRARGGQGPGHFLGPIGPKEEGVRALLRLIDGGRTWVNWTGQAVFHGLARRVSTMSRKSPACWSTGRRNAWSGAATARPMARPPAGLAGAGRMVRQRQNPGPGAGRQPGDLYACRPGPPKTLARRLQKAEIAALVGLQMVS